MWRPYWNPRWRPPGSISEFGPSRKMILRGSAISVPGFIISPQSEIFFYFAAGLLWIMLQISQQLSQVEAKWGTVVSKSAACGCLLCTQPTDNCCMCCNEHGSLPQLHPRPGTSLYSTRCIVVVTFFVDDILCAQACPVWDHGATFSKLPSKIFGRFLFAGKDAHFRNFFVIPKLSGMERFLENVLGKYRECGPWFRSFRWLSWCWSVTVFREIIDPKNVQQRTWRLQIEISSTS